MILVSFCDKNNKINNYLSTPSTQVQKELSKYKNYFIPYSSANIRSAEAFKHSVHTCNVLKLEYGDYVNYSQVIRWISHLIYFWQFYQKTLQFCCIFFLQILQTLDNTGRTDLNLSYVRSILFTNYQDVTSVRWVSILLLHGFIECLKMKCFFHVI